MPLIPIVQDGEFAVIFPLLPQMPMSRLVGCAELEQYLAVLKSSLMNIHSNSDIVASDLLSRVNSHVALIEQKTSLAKSSLNFANINDTIAQVNLGISSVFLILGIVLTGPIAVGTLAAGGVISTSAISYWQLYAQNKAGQVDLAFAVAYERDRLLLLGALSADNAGSSAGIVISRTLSAVGFLLSAIDLVTSNKELDKAQQELKTAISDLELISSTFKKYGNDRARWLNAYQNALEGGINQLTSYITATKSTNCIITGPQLKKN